jgi:molybdopterin converting factor small subunit
LKEKVGVGRKDMTLPSPATGSDLLDALARQYPDLVGYRRVIRLAVNQSYTEVDTALSDGDEVALITPVSGG